MRVAAAGSVDDGKSTLIGRLLVDSKQVLSDQLDSVSGENGDLRLSHLTDGLRAEREQGITIDVAYRYFATARRRFVLADTPGHERYTRNMVTGASRADASIILIDARHGIVAQTRRHLAISAVLAVPHVVAAVNKMDAVDWDGERFAAVAREFADLARASEIPDPHAVPISALEGDNVVERSARTPFYAGPSVLELLEQLEIEPESDGEARLPVQWVIDDGDGGVAAGQLARGGFDRGDAVVVLPGGQEAVVERIEVLGEELRGATAPRSVAMRLSDGVTVRRGDVIAPRAAPAPVRSELDVTVCWLATAPLDTGDRLVVRVGAAETVGTVEVRSVVDLERPGVDTPADRLELNDIGRTRIRLETPLVADRYRDSRYTGSAILIEPETNVTAAAAVVMA